MQSTKLKRTPLFDNHQKLGAKFVPFAGWEMPVLYSGVVAEHQAVREAAGIFDVSHMGEILVEGPEAEQALQLLTCNDVAKLNNGKAQYSAITNESGGIVDDIIIYRLSPNRFLLCVNASNAEKDFQWLVSRNTCNAKFTDLSEEYGQIAVQGPKAFEIFSELVGAREEPHIEYFHFALLDLFGAEIIAARTGYTGEDGVELFLPRGITSKVWDALLEIGAPKGLVPAGLGARDSLRLEACYPLHGHELREDVSAIESGLGWIVKLKKGRFLGHLALEKHKSLGAPRSLVGFHVVDKGIVREESKVFSEDGREIGTVTSGTKTPTIGKALGLALVASELSQVGSYIFAEVRGRRLACEIVKTPFYRRSE